MFDMMMVVKAKERVEPGSTVNVRMVPSGLEDLSGELAARFEVKLSGLSVEAAAKYEIGKQVSVTATIRF